MPSTDSHLPIAIIFEDPIGSGPPATFTLDAGLPEIVFQRLSQLLPAGESVSPPKASALVAIIATLRSKVLYSSEVMPKPLLLSPEDAEETLNDLTAADYVVQEVVRSNRHLRLTSVMIELNTPDLHADQAVVFLVGKLSDYGLSKLRAALLDRHRPTTDRIDTITTAVLAAGYKHVTLCAAPLLIEPTEMKLEEVSGALKMLANMGYVFVGVERDDRGVFG
jgi:hypothetical protein